MNIKIVDYDKKLDEELLNLFYCSTFYKRKELEYTRFPSKWIQRYEIAGGGIQKIAVNEDDGKIIASLGILPKKCKAGENNIVAGCFVDNSILPEYLNNYNEIFDRLFDDVEEEMKSAGMDVIYGWDFLHHIDEHFDFFKKRGYSKIDEYFWYSGGTSKTQYYPLFQNPEIGLKWDILLMFSKYMQKFYEFKLKKLPENINITHIMESDLNEITEFMTGYYKKENIEFSPVHSSNELKDIFLKNDMHGIVAKDRSRIMGVLLYIVSSWSGWFLGRPYYDEKFEHAFTLTVDEFIVDPEHRDTTLASHMILELMKVKDPEKRIMHKSDYSLITDIFDRRIKWRRDAYLNIGCIEPEYDYGTLIAKSLKDNIKIDKDKIWHLPARYIVSPVVVNP